MFGHVLLGPRGSLSVSPCSLFGKGGRKPDVRLSQPGRQIDGIFLKKRAYKNDKLLIVPFLFLTFFMEIKKKKSGQLALQLYPPPNQEARKAVSHRWLN